MRHHKDWLKAYMQYSAHSEAPDKMHFWVGVWTIAGALRRRVWIDQGYFQWTPNMYLILVAPPGIVSKSTTLSIGANLLRQIEGIKFGPDAITWQALTQALAGANEAVLMPDGTYHPMSCISIASSEFGTFFNPNDREMVDVLVSLWDGQLGVWEKQTKTQGGDRIENPWINMAACTTPGWIAGSFPEYLIGGGFTSRCLFVFAKQKRRLVAYPSAVLPPGFKEQQRALVQDLERISTLAGPYTLSSEAIAFGEKWYENHYTNRPKHLDNERFGGYLARKQTHIHKLALVLTAARSDSPVINVEELSAATEIVTGLEDDMPQVFEYIGVEGAAKHSTGVMAVVRTHKRISQQELFRYCFRSMSYREFQEALTAAVQSRQITLEQKDGKIWIELADG
jgi:Protein of unknown function (DUF3987)